MTATDTYIITQISKANQVFAIPFAFLDKGLHVSLSAKGETEPLIQGQDYTISGSQLTLKGNHTGKSLIIARQTPIEQPFKAAHKNAKPVEKALDQMVMVQQDQATTLTQTAEQTAQHHEELLSLTDQLKQLENRLTQQLNTFEQATQDQYEGLKDHTDQLKYHTDQLFNRTLRVPEGEVLSLLPPRHLRAGELITFLNTGNPVPVAYCKTVVGSPLETNTITHHHKGWQSQPIFNLYANAQPTETSTDPCEWETNEPLADLSAITPSFLNFEQPNWDNNPILYFGGHCQ